MRIMVTGGAGYIGSHAVRRLVREGHDVVVVDNLSHGHREAVARQARFYQADVGDRGAIGEILRAEGIEAVMHFAAYIEVGESVQDPALYYRNNLTATLALLATMLQANVKRFVFSSTAAVYGNPAYTPIDEEHPRQPINPYGRAKLMVEEVLQDYAAAYGLSYVTLRYFNVAGACPDGSLGEAHEPESHLIPRILSVAAGGAEAVTLFGNDYPTPDGTCIRDYVHVEDLVAAHVLALDRADGRAGGSVYNLGSEVGFSVRQVIEVVQEVTKRNLPIRELPRRPGDPAVLVATSRKIQDECGWRPNYPDLKTIIEHAWRWHQRQAFAA